MKKITTVILFSLISVFLLFHYNDVFIVKLTSQNAKQYGKENHDIDIFFLGTSRIYFTMSPIEIWNRYGIISYNRASSLQPVSLTYIIMQEIVDKYQPKIIIIDALNFLINNNDDKFTLETINSLLPISYRFSAYEAVLDTVYNPLDITSSFHSRWKSLNQYDFITQTYWKGMYNNGLFKMYKNLNKYEYSEEQVYDNISLSDNSIDILNKIDKLAKSHNIDIIFINMPASISLGYYKKSRIFAKYIEQFGFSYIDYNLLYDDININFDTDFRDHHSHLNIYGGRKVMDHLISYIIEHYDIPDRKNDQKYASWNEDYIKYERAINREEIRELKLFTEWETLAFYDNYTMLISTNGDNVLNRLPQDMKDKFKTLGLTKYETDKSNMKYAAIIDDGKVFYEEMSDKKAEYKGRMKNIVNLLVSSENKKATINVSGKTRSKNKYGMNFVIYDKVNREIVDSIWLDPANFNQVKR